MYCKESTKILAFSSPKLLELCYQSDVFQKIFPWSLGCFGFISRDHTWTCISKRSLITGVILGPHYVVHHILDYDLWLLLFTKMDKTSHSRLRPMITPFSLEWERLQRNLHSQISIVHCSQWQNIVFWCTSLFCHQQISFSQYIHYILRLLQLYSTLVCTVKHA